MDIIHARVFMDVQSKNSERIMFLKIEIRCNSAIKKLKSIITMIKVKM